MATSQSLRFFSLLQREFREYRNSLFWTPIIAAVLLALLMLGSVVLANRISVFGDVMLDSILDERRSVNVQISMVEDGNFRVPVVVIDDDDSLEDEVDGRLPPPPDAPAAPSYTVTLEESAPAEQWNFSREWSFNPPDDDDAMAEEDVGSGFDGRDMDGRELNTMLTVVHSILTLILFLTTANYLLGTLYDDRKDRSILFFRSMPVSEWEIVLAKFVMALVVAPLIYLAVSIVLQFVYVVLLMLLVWRMDKSPIETVLDNVDFLALVGDPIGGWVLTALWIAPLYAYLLLASAAARRSPFMMAVVPVLALFIGEAVFFGSEHIGDAVQRHVPHLADDSSVGFYLFGPSWSGIDLASMGAGLLFAALAVAGAVWLRRYRWEL